MFKGKVLFLSIFLFSQIISGQCAMCRAVVEQGDSEMAEGINSGIIYLMIFPYLLLATAIYFLYKNWKKRSLE